MSGQAEIIFMQTRLIRLASEEWQMPVAKIIELFSKFNIWDYIEKGYDIFHCEGDGAVLEDIMEYLANKGVRFND